MKREPSPPRWFDGRRVRPGIYTDPALFQVELQRIFERSWIYLAHESEIPAPGDFKCTSIGREPVIVVRAADGGIRVLRNRCRHKGATVCQAERGRTDLFRCAYHGWAYELDGRLRALPEPEGYGKEFRKEDYPLLPVPRVDSYRGLVFASLDPGAPHLKAYLAPAVAFMDEFLDQAGEWKLECAGEVKIRVRTNWKVVIENSTDGYHFRFTHSSYLNLLDQASGERQRVARGTSERYTRDAGNGHGVIHGPRGQPPERPRVRPRCWDEFESQVKERYPGKAAKIIRAASGTAMNVCLFPNLSLSDMFFREVRPIAVDMTEVRYMAFSAKGAPDEVNDIRLRIHETFQGAGGLGNTDDLEAWQRVQEGLAACPDEWVPLSRGLVRETTESGGARVAASTDDTAVRGMYREWSRLMAAEPNVRS